MLIKPFDQCIGKKVICPNCYVDLLNGNIKLIQDFVGRNYAEIEINDGYFSTPDFYDEKMLKVTSENYECMACGYELIEFFKYLNSLQNTSEMNFSDEVSTFLSEIYDRL